MSEHVDVLVLGAGIAGLGAAEKAKRCGREAVLFEAQETAGGLLDNFIVNGFRFDNAVHLSFSEDKEVRDIFDRTPYLTHPTDSFNFDEDRWLKHPVQNNLYPLEAEDKVELIESFLARPDSMASDDYGNWLLHQYGEKITDRFPGRYTRKYWQTDARNLSTTWIGKRMRRAELSEILYGAVTDQTPNTYYAKEMRYPKEGGYKAFIEPLIEAATIRCGHRAVAIDLNGKSVRFGNGNEVTYTTLVNTLPLPLFVALCGVTRGPLHDAAAQLKATSIDLISVGFNRKVTDYLWFYMYDEDILASRAYSPSIKSPANAPDGCSSLQFEIYNPDRTSQHQPDDLIENVRYALAKMKLATEDDILFMHHKHLPWGNVIFFKEMEKHRQVIRDFMAAQKVETCGRFGEWDYLWSHQAFLSGLNVSL
ncbi:protoporphyrinogen/coproporphyrinogen oxidase [Kordiimonas aestuarii]|uniref:protoporphyrinogen/coproporphyrinogen oxidase n=1 Tax=Kordiimonas aestuarii TaxID=1005925 RepID=UPI0021D3D6B5|nr:NAD(P)-binding protein [Kordiimonas aestuarii]